MVSAKLEIMLVEESNIFRYNTIYEEKKIAQPA
jgi:hypothetical protein